jgi:hypothetical protein
VETGRAIALGRVYIGVLLDELAYCHMIAAHDCVRNVGAPGREEGERKGQEHSGETEAFRCRSLTVTVR